VEVVCQIRFPPILAIQAAPPAAFQDAIRNSFPLMEDEPGAGLPSGIDIPIPPEMRKLLGGTGPSYKFASEDGLHNVTLVRDSLAYSTNDYTVWDDFKKLLAIPVSALVSIYKPSFYARIGLRY